MHGKRRTEVKAVSSKEIGEVEGKIRVEVEDNIGKCCGRMEIVRHNERNHKIV